MEQPSYALEKTFACLPRTVRGVPLVLGEDPKGKHFLYCCGNSVIIRNICDPAVCDIYTEHSTLTTVAKYSPSGFYIASGDTNGKIRIWDTTQKEHLLKKEYQFLSGPIRDIAWSKDNQRLAVVGEGRDRFGHVFLFDTGTSNGTLTGQAKPINSVDFRPGRPMRIVTASEDYTLAIFEGPPFKFKNLFQHHTRFAQCVRYNNDGSLFASGGADGKVFLFDGLEGELKGELIDENCKSAAHAGGVYALCWNPDGSRLLTASGDKTSKVWDIATKNLQGTFTCGSEIEDQQLGCLWQGEHVITVSLSGFISYLDPSHLEKPKKVIQGHNKAITSVTVDAANNFIYSADMEGFVTRWDANSGDGVRLSPKFHKAQVQKIVFNNNLLATVSIDDTLAIMDSTKNCTAVAPKTLKLPAQPRGICVSSKDVVAVACQKELIVYDTDLHKLASASVPAVLTCVAVHPDHKTIAAGGEDSIVRLYEFSNNSLNMIKELQQSGAIADLAFSPDGNYLATCDAARRVVPYKVPSYELASPREWTFHTARVNCLSWSPDSKHIATGSLDTNVIVWSVDKPGEYPIIIKSAHQMSQVNGVAWLTPTLLTTVGQDANVKQWRFVF